MPGSLPPNPIPKDEEDFDLFYNYNKEVFYGSMEAKIEEIEVGEVERWLQGFKTEDREAAKVRGGNIHQAVLQETQNE